MRWTVAVLVVAVGMGAASAQAAPATQSQPAAQRKAVRLTVQPANEPVPALKYQLLPPLDEQIHGDAMTLYYVVMDQVAGLTDRHKIDAEAIRLLWDAPPEEFDKDKVRAMLKEFDPIMPMLDMATRQTDCNWNLQERRLGFSTALPALSRWQSVARMIALRTRLAIIEGRHDDAIRSLQMGYAMARHAAGGPTFIQALVGVSLASKLNGEVPLLIGAKGAPNLYWALAALPKPFADENRSILVELDVLYYTVPELREARAGRLTPQQWEALPEVIGRRLGPTFEGRDDIPDAAKGIFPTTVLPVARDYWRQQGLSDKQIEAMPVNQANIVYSLAMYDRLWADMAKWFSLPYWQGHAGVDRVSRQVEDATRSSQAGLLFFLAGNVARGYAHQAVLHDDFAAFQTIEAVRMYAARHDGKLPATLAELTDPPAPISPITGQPFRYEATGNTFVLDIPEPRAHPGTRQVKRYEVTVLPQ